LLNFVLFGVSVALLCQGILQSRRQLSKTEIVRRLLPSRKMFFQAWYYIGECLHERDKWANFPRLKLVAILQADQHASPPPRFKPDRIGRVRWAFRLLECVVAFNVPRHAADISLSAMRTLPRCSSVHRCNIRFSPAHASVQCGWSERAEPASGSEDEERGIILWFHWCTWVALPRAATATAHVRFVPPICLVCTLEDLYSRFICHLRPAALYAEAMFHAIFAIMTFVLAIRRHVE
jgi:hypothetical protein